jgi:hypothetical protein
MFDTVTKKAVATKNFVSKHRVSIAVTLTAALAVKWQMNVASEWNDFLKEHDLFDEFYAMHEDA